MKTVLQAAFSLLLIAVLPCTSHAEVGGQVFYKFGFSMLTKSRENQVFTDTNGAAGLNNGKTGWNISAGLDTALVRKLGPGDIIGEVMLDYAHFSRKTVLQPTSALLGGTNKSNVTISEFMAVVAPKYRVEAILDGALRPWIIPIGVSFMVNSPPSNDSNYLDIGFHLGAGVEYMILGAVSIGIDYRYTFSVGEPGFKSDYGTADGYLGIDF